MLPNYPGPPRVSPFCLGFRSAAMQGGEQSWEAIAQIPFRSHGLLVWGASKETFITSCEVGHIRQVMASQDPVPALFFESGMSFADLCKRLCDAEGKLLPLKRRKAEQLASVAFFSGWLVKHPKVQPHQLFSLDTASPGTSIVVKTRGPFDQLVLWGLGAP